MADPFERTCFRRFDRHANAQRPGRQSSANDSTGPESGAIAGGRATPIRFRSFDSKVRLIHGAFLGSARISLNRPGCCRLSAIRPANPLPSDCRLPGAAMAVICEKQQPGDRPIGTPQPAPSHGPSFRKRRVVCCSQPGNASPRRGRRADHEQPADVADVPSTAHNHLAGESRLAIQPVKGGLRVGDDRLDLDDEQGAEERVEREDIDRPTLAPDRERDLDVNDPPKASEKLHERIDQPGMCLVDQAVESLASPSKVEVHVRAERGRRPQERAHVTPSSSPRSIDAINERERPARAETSR